MALPMIIRLVVSQIASESNVWTLKKVHEVWSGTEVNIKPGKYFKKIEIL